jgi:hypothetical protein
VSDIRSSIGLTREQFIGSLERILAFYSMPKTQEEAQQAKAYTDALFEAIPGWDAVEFEEVCQRLTLRLNPMKKPMPKDFFIVRDMLYEDRRAEKEKCKKCSDSGMLYVRVKHRQYNEEFPACVPCPACHKLKNAKLKPELELIPGSYVVGNPENKSNPFVDFKMTKSEEKS